MENVFAALTALAIWCGLYGAVGIALPRLPLIRTRKRAAMMTLAAVVGFFVFGSIGLELEPPEARAARMAEQQAAREQERRARRPEEVSQADFGDKWPLTISGGTLKCRTEGQRQYVTLDAGAAGEYAVNGSARQFAGVKDVREITRRQAAAHTGPIAAGVSEATRRQAFADIVRCEDEGGESETCWARARQRHKLTAEQITHVRYEGLNKFWPPLQPPPPMSVQPLIDIGLKLCVGT